MSVATEQHIIEELAQLSFGVQISNSVVGGSMSIKKGVRCYICRRISQMQSLDSRRCERMGLKTP